MQLTLIRKSEITRTVLPKKIGGQHFVKYKNENGDYENLIAVSASEKKWVCKNSKYVDFLGECTVDQHGNKEIVVGENEFYPIVLKATNEKMILLVEPIEAERSSFKYYTVNKPMEINVGYDKSNEICFHDDGLSETVHARISYDSNNKIIVEDLHSVNGTYLNNKRIEKSEARFGDELYLVGLRIILGNGFVAVNNPGNSVTVSLQEKHIGTLEIKEADDETKTVETFSSAPRKKREISHKKFSLDQPPKPDETQNMPWAVVMGPSITMAFASVFSSVFTVQNILKNNGDITSALPTLVMSICMVLGTIIWPIFAKRFEKRARKTKEVVAIREYLTYLENIENEVEREVKEQQQIIIENNPTLEECLDRIKNKKMTLWERSPRHNDFLDIMVGVGDICADIEISHPAKSTGEKLNKAGEEMYKLAEKERVLKDVPITIPFSKRRIIGLTGNRKKMIAAVKAMLIETVALHNYNDLKIIFIYDEKERNVWNSVKWLPHLWNKDKTVRYIANDVEEAKELSNVISNIQAVHSNNKDNDIEEAHYLIIATDRALTEKIQAIKEFYKNPDKCDNITLVAMYNEQRYLPKSCSVVCNYGIDKTTVSNFGNITGEEQLVKQPCLYEADPENVFIDMSNIFLDEVSSESMLPTELTYLEMFEAGKPEHLDILARWEENDSVKSLSAPIGVDADGFNIKLDIHEKAHGPHGLIAGMTGSGKSEFIISYIAAMAMNYSPEEVAFVLIDFKGGGMADVFKKLPHLAGSMTNLDGNELQRSFIAIESELEKRQALFKEISEQKKISNIDIYKYQKLRQTDKSLKPLPHLIIISDEFAELKQQHDDFMQQLIRIARIGRSLGVHLILATQKPDGVVDDQIRSNIKFKVCLKVQDKADSQSVIGCPDATLITNAGRFYLQVGYNELFEYGQSPWSGATYFPVEQFQKNKSKRIDILNEQGRVIYKVAPKEPPRDKNVPEKQIDALVEYISNIADEKGYKNSKLWLEPLEGPQEVENNNIMDETDARPFVLNPIVGMYDDLKNQLHKTLTVPFTNKGNAIVYGASGSGKLEFLNQMSISIMERHMPQEIQIYAFDFDSGSLSAFAESPYFRIVALSNERDAIMQALDEIQKEISNRKELFKKYGGDYQNYIANSGETVPNILLMVHNFFAFTEEISEGEDLVSKIAREGKKYGVFVVLTGQDSNSVRYRLLPMFSNIYVLQQNNNDQYADILGRTEGIVPSKFKGRGIFKENNTTYEFQTNMVFEDSENTYEAIVSFCKESLMKNGNNENKMKLMPAVIDESYFEEQGIAFTSANLPVAVSKGVMNSIYLDLLIDKVSYITYEESENEITGIVNVIAKLNELKYSFDLSGCSVFANVEVNMATTEDIAKTIDEIEMIVAERGKIGLEKINNGEPLPDFEHIIIMINNYSKVIEELNEEQRYKLNDIIVGITNNYHIHFVIVDRADQYRFVSEPDKLGQAMPFKNGIVTGNDERGFKGFEVSGEIVNICESGYGTVICNGIPEYGKVISYTEEK